MSAILSVAGEPVWPEDAIEVGRIVDAWGIKGAFKVQPFAGQPEALFSSRRWFLKAAEADDVRRFSLPNKPLPLCLKVTQAKEHGDGVVAQAQDVPDRNAAEALRGARVFVSRASFPSTGDGEYYWIDLIGLDVLNREGQALGVVVGLLDTGPQSVLRVQPAAAAAQAAAPDEVLIPFVAAYVDAVSLSERRITVDWGLDY